MTGSIFDASGARVRNLAHKNLLAGTLRLEWDDRKEDGSRLPAGVYFYRIEAGDRVAGGKVVTLRR